MNIIENIKIGENLRCMKNDKDFGVRINESYEVINRDKDYIYVINDNGLLVGFKRRTGYFFEPEVEPEFEF